MKQFLQISFCFAVIVMVAVIGVSYHADANVDYSAKESRNYHVIDGRVEAIYPDVVYVQTDAAMVGVKVQNLDAQDMGVAFLQIGDRLKVNGEFDQNAHFDAQKLIEVEPLSDV